MNLYTFEAILLFFKKTVQHRRPFVNNKKNAVFIDAPPPPLQNETLRFWKVIVVSSTKKMNQNKYIIPSVL